MSRDSYHFWDSTLGYIALGYIEVFDANTGNSLGFMNNQITGINDADPLSISLQSALLPQSSVQMLNTKSHPNLPVVGFLCVYADEAQCDLEVGQKE